MRDLARGLVEGIAGRGEADLYETLCKPLPMLLITRLLGIERDEAFWAWTDTLIYGRVDGTVQDEIRAAADSLYGFLAAQIADRRAQPGRRRPDLAAPARRRRGPALPRGRDPRPLLLPAHRGPREHRLRHPRDAPSPGGRARASRGRAGRPGARPQPRRAVAAPLRARDRALPHGDAHTEVAGQTIAEGERVLLLFGSANRDPAVFPDADSFHLDRRDGRHVAFGIGPHRCVGSNLARLELRVAVEELLRLIPDFRLADGPDPGWYDATSLNIVWDAWMKVEVDRSMCVGHAQCMAICPAVFAQRRARIRRRDRGRDGRARARGGRRARGRLVPRAGDPRHGLTAEASA